MKISITIMGHPKRDAQIQELLIKIVDMQRFCDVSVAIDNNNSEWDTGSRALKKGIGKGDWHLVLQDDAILTPDFYNNIEAALAAVPSKSVISLYTGKVKPFAERVELAVNKAEDGNWLNGFLLFWGVAVLIPSDHIEPMLEFVADRTEQYDTRIGIFYQRNMLPIYYTVPSLVEHDDALGTLIPHHATEAPRVAHRLATGLVSWNSDVINI